MKTYSVWGKVTIGCFCTVEAETEQEALEKANRLSMGTLCHQACSDDPQEAWVVSELDGQPEALEAAEQEGAP